MSFRPPFPSEAAARRYAEAVFAAECRAHGCTPEGVRAGTEGWARNSITGEFVLPQRTVRAYGDPIVARDGTALLTHVRRFEALHGARETVGGAEVVIDASAATAVERTALTRAQRDRLDELEAERSASGVSALEGGTR